MRDGCRHVLLHPCASHYNEDHHGQASINTLLAVHHHTGYKIHHDIHDCYALSANCSQGQDCL